MNKDDLIKIAVFVVVVSFIVGTFAYQGMGRYLPKGGGETPTPEQTPTSALFGTAGIDGTVLAYPDNILVISAPGAATDAALTGRLNGLVREGKVAYVNSAGADSVNAILTGGANITEIALNLTLDFPNVTTKAKAQLELPQNASFITQAGNITASISKRVTLVIEPLAAVGRNISLLVGAMIEPDSLAVSDLQAKVADKEGTVLVKAAVSSLQPGLVIDASYPWEGRMINDTTLKEALLAKYPNATFAYHENPFITIPANASEEQKGKVQNLSYVSFVAGRTALVEEGYVNRSKVEADLLAIFNDSSAFAFEDSFAELNITAGEPDEAFLNNTFSGAQGMRIAKYGNVSLGPIVDIEGVDYVLPGGMRLEKLLPANATLGDSEMLYVKLGILGARITSVG